MGREQTIMGEMEGFFSTFTQISKNEGLNFKLFASLIKAYQVINNFRLTVLITELLSRETGTQVDMGESPLARDIAPRVDKGVPLK